MTTTKFKYYNYDKLLSYNAVFNMLIGLRGLGKTYGAKKNAIRNALTKGEEFILLRRYESELTEISTFFSDLDANDEFPDHDFKVQGKRAYGSHKSTRKDKKREWVLLGYFIALSTAQTKKGVSYHNVKTIIFDEFLIEKRGVHRYLTNEVKSLNDFYSTVDRNKDKTKVFLLANSTSITNPYFIEYNIRPDQVGEFSTYFDGFLAVHFDDSEDFRDEVYKTRFGKFIQGTEYADYAVENTFMDSNGNLLKYKPSDAKYFMTMETRHGTFSIWLYYADHTYYIREKRPKNEDTYTLIQDNVTPGKTFLERQSRRLQLMRAAYNNGRMFFESPRERNAFIEIFRQY